MGVGDRSLHLEALEKAGIGRQQLPPGRRQADQKGAKRARAAMSGSAAPGFGVRRDLRRVAAALFVPYLCVLTLLFVVKRPAAFREQLAHFRWTEMGHTVNLLPGRTILYYITLQENYQTGVAQLGGNLAGFVPFGFLLPLFYRPARRALRLAELASALSLLFELFQYATNVGSFDVDDLLLNVSGAVCGFFVLRCMLQRSL
ncbi:VanZ family protein [Flaviaesturariibacter aridisoli]|uniref:VanZ family protein n=2 Tax=Flaviaesturariibacter aridisoli TaxID=2545761 RepID=A0A4R4DX90_9BACT|nr:VanZ family protein [Flaviaesturariibacter aridisoli]